MEKKMLSICIPTYNRPELLKKALLIFLDEAESLGVDVYISDDSTNNKTQRMVSELQKKYRNIHYRKNEKPHGIEGNFFTVLSMADTKYKWLLGDDDSLTKGSIERVLKILNGHKDLDALIVNACRLKDKRYPEKGCRSLRVKNKPSKLYTDRNLLLKELGWHTTFMSTIIYGSHLIENFNRERYKGSIFPQFVLLYDYLGRKDSIKVYFDENPAVYTLNIGSIGSATWFRDIIKIFTKDWFEAVHSLPSTYSKDAKLTCVKNHDRYTGVFSPLKLLYIRSFGHLDRKIITEYKDFIRYTMNIPHPVLYFASVFPKPLATFMREIYLKIKGGY